MGQQCDQVFDENVRLGHTEIVEILINDGRAKVDSDILMKSVYREPHWEIKEKPAIIKLLLDAGGNVDARDNEGKTALLYTKNVEIAEMLIAAGADVNTRDNEGKTALMLAQNIEMVKFLIAAGVQFNPRGGHFRHIWGHFTHSEEIIERMKLLISSGFEVNTQDEKGETALMWAVRYNLIDVIRLLLSLGADVNVQAKDGTTALMWVKSKEVFGILTSFGAKIQAVDQNKMDILMHYVNKDFDKEVIHEMISAGVNINAKDSKKRTALMHAADHNNYRGVEALLAMGADVNAVDEDHKTALRHISREAFIQSMIMAGADINIPDNKNISFILTFR